MSIAFRAYRKLKQAVLRGAFSVDEIAPRAEFAVTLLAGDLGGEAGARALLAAEEMAGTQAVQVVGFRFRGAGEDEGERGFELVELSGERFPEFHRALATALIRVGGARLEAYDAGLCGLGLGLLANYHFQKPLVFAGRETSLGGDWDDPELMDPASSAWEKLLSGYAGDGARFAGDFCRFYEKIRGES